MVPMLLWKSGRKIAVTILGILLFMAALVAAHEWTIPAEDAVILYDYARNLANSSIITYGGADYPIEGATDFLWMVLIACLGTIGFDEFAASLALTGVSTIAMINGFGNLRSRAWIIFGLLATPYLYASLSGFSAIFFSACYVWCLSLQRQRHPFMYSSVLILCLIRPDGVVWGAGIVASVWLDATRRHGWRVASRPVLFQLIAPGILYFIFRSWYFGEWLPLPFLVKASGERDWFIFFNNSLKDVFAAAAPLLAVAILNYKNKDLSRKLFTLFFIPILFYSAMRLEQNIGNRFLAPLFFGGAYTIIYSTNIKSLAVFILAAIICQYSLTTKTIVQLLNSRSENVYHISQALSARGGRMLITESGRLAYYSHWRADDSWGLNTPRFAHTMIKSTMIRRGEYDLVVAHCDVNLLVPSASLTHGPERSWDNHCIEIMKHLKQGGYTIYLAPFLRPGSTTDEIKAWLNGGKRAERAACLRHDIYAVSQTSVHRTFVEQVLIRNHALIYEEKLRRNGGDMVCP